MTAGKGPPFLRHLLGGSAETDPRIAPGLAGAVQGGQSGAQDRPRPSRGCAGEAPYRGRTEGAGLFLPFSKNSGISLFLLEVLAKNDFGEILAF